MTNKTNIKCSQCGRNHNLKRKTFFVAMTAEGLVCVTQCASKDLTILGQSSKESEAREIADLVGRNLQI